MSENAFLWSVTASDNATADPAVPWVENMLPGAVNNVARATMAAVARMLKDLNGSVATTGSSSTYAATSNSGHSGYSDGILLTVKANHTNDNPATLNLNTFGAKSIRIFGPTGETALIGGEIRSGGTYQLRYDTSLNSAAGAWLLLNPNSIQEVGTIKLWGSDTAPFGWFLCNGQAVSRTTYAALFAIIGTTFGTGDGSTTFNVPDLRGRAPFGTDDMGTSAASRVTNAKSGIVGTTLGASGGLEDHTLTLAQSPAHTHAGTTGDQSQVHTHSGTTGTESADHTHAYDRTTAGATFPVTGGGVSVLTSVTQTPTNSGGKSTTHTHDITTGSESANHNHAFTTDSKGSGTAHNNMPPALMLNFIIRV